MALVGASCSSGSDGAETGAEIQGGAEASFVEVARQGGDDLEEDPIIFASVEELASESDVAVVGTVERVRPGRSIPVGRLPLTTFTFIVAVEKVLLGEVEDGDELVFEWYLPSDYVPNDVAPVEAELGKTRA